MTIGYLGPKGSFSHAVTALAFQEEDLVSYPSIYACLNAAQMTDIDYAVVPIENTIEGTVHPSLDFLYQSVDIGVRAEYIFSIQQQLILSKKRKLKDITHIYSHPHALSQCQIFIHKNLPQAQLLSTESTSAAAEYIKLNLDKPYAAIGPKRAAQHLDLHIACANIQDIADNETRFWVCGKQKMIRTADLYKTSLCFVLKENQVGSLYEALAVFKSYAINLCKLESRPLKTRLGEYYFFAEIQGRQAKIQEAIGDLKKLGAHVNILGSYPVFIIEQKDS